MAPGFNSVKTAAKSSAGKATAGLGSALGVSDLVEGSGLDKTAAAASGAANRVGGGLVRAGNMVGDTVRDMLGGFPWEQTGQEVAESASSIILDVLAVVL